MIDAEKQQKREWQIDDGNNNGCWEKIVEVRRKGERSVKVLVKDKNKAKKIFGMDYDKCTKDVLNKYGGGKLWMGRNNGNAEISTFALFDEWIKFVDIGEYFNEYPISRDYVELLLLSQIAEKEKVDVKTCMVEIACLKMCFNYLVEKWNSNYKEIRESKENASDIENIENIENDKSDVLTSNKSVLIDVLEAIECQLDYLSDLMEIGRQCEFLKDSKPKQDLIDSFGYKNAISPYGSIYSQYRGNGCNIGDLAGLIIIEKDLVASQAIDDCDVHFPSNETDLYTCQLFETLFPFHNRI